MTIKDYKKTNPTLRETTLCYLIKADDILLAEKKRGMGVGKINGVGGKRNPGETIEEANVRETSEEIGVDLKNFWQVATLYFYFPDDPTDLNGNVKVWVYMADSWSGEPGESEEMKPKWYKLSGIPTDLMWEADAIWLPQVLNGKKVIAEFSYDKNYQLIEHQIKVVDNISKL